MCWPCCPGRFWPLVPANWTWLESKLNAIQKKSVSINLWGKDVPIWIKQDLTFCHWKILERPKCQCWVCEALEVVAAQASTAGHLWLVLNRPEKLGNYMIYLHNWWPDELHAWFSCKYENYGLLFLSVLAVLPISPKSKIIQVLLFWYIACRGR